MKDIYQVIDRALLTEKGTRLAEEENKYLFRVNPSANKLEIKEAVEQLFKVKVVSVNTMNRQGKKKRQRTASSGKTADWKRAVVTLAEGNTIDFV
ncbi:50S ribosomal protein L23 [Tichowtungia aerotolerans]|uniref:Large ribosomal subunit protein uL23 n=1 Tax=Tichowtungia aerotolerans TaxID=2697043 RepID=A0A6P1M5H5_9BACT|nr:50S ribosomal protein L23 [Tichowtungia aerotolerans]QHI68253.1 50S ribosomal protein L23 [Tichowtungia aerotolerans]